MDRQSFVNAFVECLKNNGNIVSAGDTAEGTFEAMTYSFPQVRGKGVKALHCELVKSLCDRNVTATVPSYFTVRHDFLDGLDHLISDTSLPAETHQYLTEIALLVHLLIPYVFHCKLQDGSQMDRVLEDVVDDEDIDSAFLLLLSKLNNGFGRDIRASFSNQISLYSILKEYLVFMMSLPFSSPISRQWPELLTFLLDFTVSHPEMMPQTADFILSILHSLEDASSIPSLHREWKEEFCEMAMSVVHSLSTSYEILECSDPRVLSSLLSLVRQLLASLLPLAQLHLQPIDRVFLRLYLQLLDFYATTAGDVFSEVSSFGGGILLYSVLTMVGSGDELGATSRHVMLAMSLKSVSGFAYYKRVNALKEPLIAGDAFDATCWRLLLDVVDLQKEKERFREALQRSFHVTYLAEVESVLELMAESPVVRAFDEKKKEVLRNLLVDMRSQLAEEINEVAEEEANHVSTGEEVKERNTVLDRNVCQHTSNLIKRVLSLVIYGRNKVDSHVCYKSDRSMSSANSLRDRTLGFGV